MILGITIGGFGLLLLFLSVAMLNSLRANRLQLRRLKLQVELMEDELRTPEEREAIRRRTEEIEAQKRVLFGLYENAGG